MHSILEFAWSSLKAAVKRDVAAMLPRVLRGEGKPDDMSMSEFRGNTLFDIVTDRLPVITPETCRAYINNCQTLFQKVLDREDMIF